MKIEIWSDIMCPFCYIGKRHLELALQQFPEMEVELVWKSFQLDPTITPQPGKDVYSYLAERKGMSLEESKQMHQHVVDRAAEVGLVYNYDKAIIANSFDAHRLLHLAKRNGKGNELKEKLLAAYFTEGKDFGDKQVLTQLGLEVGLKEEDIHTVLYTDMYAREFQADIQEAQEIGVRGVPFFVFDRKYAVSGAQPIEAFVETIQAVLQK
ncbi:MAG: DsbA family protein [Fluviicola sp.]|jgi:protein disulfide-isomerase